MQKRWSTLAFITALVLTALFVWQLPTILKAMPSRYVARLPEPIQAFGVREHVDVLPTAVHSAQAEELLQPLDLPAQMGAENNERSTAPPTPTPPPTRGPTGNEPPEDETPEEAGANAPATSTPEAPTPTVTAVPSPTQVPAPPTARLTGIQHKFQTWNNCGPATLAMALSYYDVFRTQDQTAAVLKPDPEDRNVTPEEMASYVRNETEFEALSRTNGDLATVRRLLSEGMPVIIELGIDPPGEYAWMEWYGHYLLLVAYDDQQETIWVYDSWFGTSDVPGENADDEGREISYEELDRYWRHFNRSYIVLYRPEQTELVSEIIGQDMDDEKMWQNAQQVVLAELNEEPENAFLWFNLGTVYNALQEYERAASAFDKARSIGLPWRMLWYQFGPYEAYYQTGRYEDVIVLADVTLQDRPYFEESYYYKALAQIELGEVDDAQENLRRAVDFNPNFQPAAEALRELEVAER
ncbi:MAG: C39 family peptidase [Chloroflexota bacterium]